MPASDDGGHEAAESHPLRGPIDGGALFDFRTVFEQLEPLASADADDPVNPTVLRVQLADGVGVASDARLDVAWTLRDDYSVHYTDSAGRNLRWDVHPHDYPLPSDDPHFHPPPDAPSDDSEVEGSCIGVSEVELVARAVRVLWRRAYERETFQGINAVEDPP